MIIEISAAVASISFVILTVFLIITLNSHRKNTNKIQADVNNLSATGIQLIKSLTDLTEDIKEKSESIDFVFRYLNIFNNKTYSDEERRARKNSEKLTELVEVISSGIELVNRIKGDIKKYVKPR